MRRPVFSTTDLTGLQHQLSGWRGRQSGRPRLPEALWTAATELARTHGPSLVARTLGLDYSRLRERLGGNGSAATVPATFVEMKTEALSGISPGESSVELSDGTGARMTLRVRSDRATLVALAQSFWRRGR
jgi:hypothetical protein